MKVKMDQAGRIVLPKPTRDRLRVRAGSGFELEEKPEGIILHPIDQQPALKKEHDLWVHHGTPTRQIDWERIVGDDREERIAQLLRR